MSVRFLSTGQIDALVGGEHPTVGFEYPPSGMQPYYHWLVRTLHLLAEASAGGLRVAREDSGPTMIRVVEGRARIDGTIVALAGQEIDLAAYNNSTALVWLKVASGAGVVQTGAAGAGWPSEAHIKLAEVTLAGGEISAVLDRRSETMWAEGYRPGSLAVAALDGELAGMLPACAWALVTQGTTSAPSVIEIRLQDAQGQALTGTWVLRVRVCDHGQWLAASHAQIAAGEGASVVETIAAQKDLVLKSNTSGVWRVTLTDATAETVELRAGMPPVGGVRADYSAGLSVTHAG
ncbi:MAG: hypothetical protein IT443_01775 [Phycisphaeraceae bacterium]|nr:hypothetical protein [Phycisphaeraceae bacterium]